MLSLVLLTIAAFQPKPAFPSQALQTPTSRSSRQPLGLPGPARRWWSLLRRSPCSTSDPCSTACLPSNCSNMLCPPPHHHRGVGTSCNRHRILAKHAQNN